MGLRHFPLRVVKGSGAGTATVTEESPFRFGDQCRSGTGTVVVKSSFRFLSGPGAVVEELPFRLWGGSRTGAVVVVETPIWDLCRPDAGAEVAPFRDLCGSGAGTIVKVTPFRNLGWLDAREEIYWSKSLVIQVLGIRFGLGGGGEISIDQTLTLLGVYLEGAGCIREPREA